MSYSDYLNEQRIALEKGLVRKYVEALLNADLYVTVDSGGEGGEDVLTNSQNQDDIMNAMFSMDEDILHVKSDDTSAERIRGMLYFVYGNNPGEVLCDYSVCLEDIIAPVNEWADQFA